MSGKDRENASLLKRADFLTRLALRAIAARRGRATRDEIMAKIYGPGSTDLVVVRGELYVISRPGFQAEIDAMTSSGILAYEPSRASQPAGPPTGAEHLTIGPGGWAVVGLALTNSMRVKP